MDELTDYLQGPYLDEKRDIERLARTASGILKVFERFFVKDPGIWPYEVFDREEVPDAEFSFSTNAMILFALVVAMGGVSASSLIPKVRMIPSIVPDGDFRLSLLAVISTALSRFPAEISRLESIPAADSEQAEANAERQTVTSSGTFGPNDPLTLTWLLEVLSFKGEVHQDEELRETLLAKLRPVARTVVDRVFGSPEQSPLQVDPTEAVPHAFPLLRTIHLLRAIQSTQPAFEPSAGLEQVRSFMLNGAHFQLSTSTIRGGGFDAGELVFALEGALLCDPTLPDYSLFDRAFEVLADRQRGNPHWRPLRPFRVTSRGMILLPQSVEIGNSLLRICSRLDEGRDRSYFSDHVGLFKAYTGWLESRMFRGRAGDGGEIVGWESEHTFAPGRVHLWQTSQALLYLMHYAAMLQGHIARQSFRAARFSTGPTNSTAKEDPGSWTKWQRGEPLWSVGEGSQYRVYARIGKAFIDPRTGGGEPDPKRWSSLLLYGPPGTGKSTVAKEIAKALGYRFVTITPSDFITGGQEGAEARAKNIFGTLMEQSDLLILFDEVDQLLLDRQSDLYKAQGDIFKLITPGMLTKLNDLTDRKETVFVVATNFVERIDPAIKRPGRIDARLVVLPPDARQRRRFFAKGGKKGHPLIAGWGSLDKQSKRMVADRTALFSYRELIDLAALVEVTGAKGDDLRDAILVRRDGFPPTISLASYSGRVNRLDKDGRPEPNPQGPLEEFVLVAFIAAQPGPIQDTGLEWVTPVLNRARQDKVVVDQAVWQLLEERGLVEDVTS